MAVGPHPSGKHTMGDRVERQRKKIEITSADYQEQSFYHYALSQEWGSSRHQQKQNEQPFSFCVAREGASEKLSRQNPVKNEHPNLFLRAGGSLNSYSFKPSDSCGHEDFEFKSLFSRPYPYLDLAEFRAADDLFYDGQVVPVRSRWRSGRMSERRLPIVQIPSEFENDPCNLGSRRSSSSAGDSEGARRQSFICRESSSSKNDWAALHRREEQLQELKRSAIQRKFKGNTVKATPDPRYSCVAGTSLTWRMISLKPLNPSHVRGGADDVERFSGKHNAFLHVESRSRLNQESRNAVRLEEKQPKPMRKWEDGRQRDECEEGERGKGRGKKNKEEESKRGGVYRRRDDWKGGLIARQLQQLWLNQCKLGSSGVAACQSANRVKKRVPRENPRSRGWTPRGYSWEESGRNPVTGGELGNRCRVDIPGRHPANGREAAIGVSAGNSRPASVR